MKAVNAQHKNAMNAKNSSKVLITGGCGFIGANLVKYLLQESRYEIRILDNLSTGRKEYLDQILNSINSTKVSERLDATHATKHPNAINRVDFIEGDIRDTNAVEGACEGINTIVHLAAITGVPESVREPVKTYEVNVAGTQNLLEAACKNHVEGFVFASSNAAVGEKEPPINEEMVPHPISPYGASKLAGEALCLAYSHSYDLKADALRFANVYGPFSSHKESVVIKFIKKAIKEKPLTIYGDGNQTRDFIYAKDVAIAISLILETELSGEIFQIGTGQEAKILELASLIQAKAKKEGFPKPKIVHKDPRKGDIYRNYTDPSKAQRLLDFKPSFSLKQGLNKLWEEINLGK